MKKINVIIGSVIGVFVGIALMSAQINKSIIVSVVPCNSTSQIEVYTKKYAKMGYELKHVINNGATIENLYSGTHYSTGGNAHINTTGYLLIFQK